jgi:hypothetical protein
MDTNQTFAANLGLTQPLDPVFLTHAHDAVAPVVDAVSEHCREYSGCARIDFGADRSRLIWSLSQGPNA